MQVKTCLCAVNLKMWKFDYKQQGGKRKRMFLFAIIELHDKSLKARWRVGPEPLQQGALLHGFTSLFVKIIDFNFFPLLQNVP